MAVPKRLWRLSLQTPAMQPELPVILLEDLGVLRGLMFALIGVGMTLITGNGVRDALGTAMIGFLLVAIAIVLAIDTKSLLLGESAIRNDVARISEAIEADGTNRIRIRKAVQIAQVICLEPDLHRDDKQGSGQSHAGAGPKNVQP